MLYCGVFVSFYQQTRIRHNIRTNGMDVGIRSESHVITIDEKDSKTHKDTSTIVLGYRINYILTPKDICSREPDDDIMLLVLLVHSAVDNRAQRDSIRNTWASTTHRFTGVRISLVFLIGIDPDQRLMTNVLNEGNAYKDLVILDMMDTYRNLSLKSLLGLHWVTEFCEESKFVLKLDDDVYVDLQNIIKLLDARFISDEIYNAKRDIYNKENIINNHLSNSNQSIPFVVGHGLVGSVNRNSRVMRYGLWSLNYKLHPEEFYPDYCSGNMYLMNRTVVKLLLQTSYSYRIADDVSEADVDRVTRSGEIRFVPFEDVFITGYLAQRIGLRCYHHDAFPHWSVGINRANIIRLIKGELLGLHNVYYQQMYKVHKLVTKR